MSDQDNTFVRSYPTRGRNNQLLSVSLFYEPWLTQSEASKAEDIQKPPFSLWEKEGYISGRLTFLEEHDPTGVKWALKYLEGVNHLNRLMKCSWFREAFEAWQGELEQILVSEALQSIQETSKGSTPSALAAAKFLAQKDWKRPGKGRPSKDQIASEAKKAAEDHFSTTEDMKRILRIV